MKKLLLLLIIPCIGYSQNKVVDATRNWKEKEGYNILASFAELLSIPNHGSDAVNIRRNAKLIGENFTNRGFKMQLLEVEGAPPAIYGELKTPNAHRTVCFYVHYDGQPVDPSRWVNPPFEPTLYSNALFNNGKPIPMPKAGDKINENWRLYGRSTSDDKAPIIALLAAIDALQNSEIAFTSNIKLFFDGEEEMGSPHVMDYLTNFNSLFEDIDVWLMVDGPVFLTGQPVLNFGSRGITGMELTVYGATRPLHSGHYGNYAPVPGQMLAALLATMKDEKGKVLIEGYYDTVEPISDFEREQINKIPKIDEQIRTDLGIAQPEGDGENLYERLLLPSLTIRGLSSGNVGALARNVIPNIAVATLGMRLVKGNDPEQMMNLVEAHIKKQGWHIVYDEPDMETRMNYPRIIKVEREKDGGPASKISMNHPAVLPVIESIKSFTGDNLVLIPSSGGSNNAKVAVLDGIKMPGVSISIANHDNNQHAENENIRIGNLWFGIDLMGVLLTMPEPKTELKKK